MEKWWECSCPMDMFHAESDATFPLASLQ
jgi:hypothetical protein